MIKAEKIFKYRIKLSKSKDSITRHEARKMLCAALLNSGLMLALNKGNPKLNLGPGAAPNEASLCEFADISLLRESSEEEIKNKLAPFVTGGFKIESVKEVPYAISSVEVLASYAAYNIKGLKGDIDKAAKSQKIEYEVLHPNGMREIKNIRLSIYSIKAEGAGEVEIIIKLDVLGSLGMAQILTMLPGLEVEEGKLEILRTALLWQKADGAPEAV